MRKFLLTFITVFMISHQAIAAEVNNAHDHVINFQKGVDAFMLGQYDLCDDYWLPLARSGDPMAARNMGLLFHKGLGVRKDVEEAVLYYEMAASAGVTSAQLMLGIMYLKGDEVKQEYPKAISYLNAAADAGNPTAAYNLGLMYELGLGTPMSKEKAARYYYNAAQLGHEKSILKMGGTPLKKENIQQEIASKTTEAEQDANIDLFAAPSDPSSVETRQDKINNIATDETTNKEKIYDKSQVMNRPDQVAFEKKLQSDDPDIMFKKDNLKGKNYTAQTPLFKNPFDVTRKDTNVKTEDGKQLISLAENNNDREMILIEKMLLNKQYTEAIEKLMPLFKAKNPDSAYYLGKIYNEGLGVEKNTTKAYHYWKEGAHLGSAKSDNALEEMRSQMSPQEMIEIERETLQ